MAKLTLVLLLVCAIVVESYVRVCYYTNWSQYRNGAGKYFLGTDYQDELCTHIIFSFGKVENNKIAPYEWNDQSRLYGELNKDLKSRDPNLKSLLAIGGWTHSSRGFSPMVATKESRTYFIKTTIAYLKEYGFDGLDLDWEFPAQRGGPTVDKQRFTYLCQELKAAFAPHGLLLTAAVTASVNGAGMSYEISKIAEALDFINLMTYDLHGSWEKTTGHHTDTSTDQSYPDHSLHNTVRHWISNGAPAEKLVLGLGSYGRTWKLRSQCEWDIGSPAAGAGPSGKYTGEGGFMAYYEICSQTILNKVCTESSSVNAPYATTSTTFIGYDDPESIVYKINNVMKAYNMGGYMFWAMDLDDFKGSCGQGRYPLLNAAKNAVLGISQKLPRCINKKTCTGSVKPPSVRTKPSKNGILVATLAPGEQINGKCRSTRFWRSWEMDVWCQHEFNCNIACTSPCPDQEICNRCECIREEKRSRTLPPNSTSATKQSKTYIPKSSPSTTTPPPSTPPLATPFPSKKPAPITECRPLSTFTSAVANEWCDKFCYRCKSSRIYSNFCKCNY